MVCLVIQALQKAVTACLQTLRLSIIHCFMITPSYVQQRAMDNSGAAPAPQHPHGLKPARAPHACQYLTEEQAGKAVSEVVTSSSRIVGGPPAQIDCIVVEERKMYRTGRLQKATKPCGKSGCRQGCVGSWPRRLRCTLCSRSSRG